MAHSYSILVILMALRSSGGNSNELKEQLWSHEERRSGSSSSTMVRLRSALLLV